MSKSKTTKTRKPKITEPLIANIGPGIDVVMRIHDINPEFTIEVLADLKACYQRALERNWAACDTEALARLMVAS